MERGMCNPGELNYSFYKHYPLTYVIHLATFATIFSSHIRAILGKEGRF